MAALTNADGFTPELQAASTRMGRVVGREPDSSRNSVHIVLLMLAAGVALVLQRRRVISHVWVLFHRFRGRRSVAPLEPPKDLAGDLDDCQRRDDGANTAAGGTTSSGELRVGARVRITGLLRRAELNGVEGSAQRFEDERWLVEYEAGEIRVRPENLAVVRTPQPRPRSRCRPAPAGPKPNAPALHEKKKRGKRAAPPEEQEMHRLTGEDCG